jgi:hypothetical protein
MKTIAFIIVSPEILAEDVEIFYQKESRICMDFRRKQKGIMWDL